MAMSVVPRWADEGLCPLTLSVLVRKLSSWAPSPSMKETALSHQTISVAACRGLACSGSDSSRCMLEDCSVALGEVQVPNHLVLLNRKAEIFAVE